MTKDVKKELSKAVMSKANGCEAREVIEEYVFDEQTEDIKLVKKKVTTKYLPPDITAVKMYLGMTQNSTDVYQKMTDAELVSEKKRLLNILKDMEEENEDYQNDPEDKV